MALAPGTKLGPYEIQSLLGAGGMGEVYRGRDTRLDRTVAIKVLPSHLSSDPESKQRMEREAKAISALQHANICTLYDIGTQDGTNFLVMEYLEGQTLADRLGKGALPLDQVLKIGTEIARALEKAHQHGIIHRDLKPANIMLTKARLRSTLLVVRLWSNNCALVSFQGLCVVPGAVKSLKYIAVVYSVGLITRRPVVALKEYREECWPALGPWAGC